MDALRTPKPRIPKDDIEALSSLLLHSHSDSEEPTTIPDSCGEEDDWSEINDESSDSSKMSKKKMQCDQCDVFLKNELTLTAHRNRQHLKNHKFSCTKCTKMFFCREELKEHIAKIHNLTGVCKCKTCGKIFATFRGMRLHVKSHQGFSFKCEHCDKVCKTESNLRFHVLTHNKSYICNHCNKTFAHKAELKQHSVKHLESPVMFACTLCSFQSKWRNAVRRHVDQVHGNTRGHVCELCGAAFRDSYNLKRHLKGNKCVKVHLKDAWEEI